MNKLLLISALLLIAVISIIQLQKDESTTQSAPQAMMIAIDPVDGSFIRPSNQQRRTLKVKQQEQTNQAVKFQYRDTLTVHPDGTKSGVVNPQFLHTIKATRNAAGEIVLHESKEPVATQPALELE